MWSRLLVVDDDPLDLLCLCKTFKHELPDTAVEGASSAERALILLAAMEFDAIISDVRMPCMDGLELLKRAKALRPNAAVFLMTGYEPKLREDALRYGASGYLQKPILMSDFLPLLRQTLEPASLIRRLRAARVDTPLVHDPMPV
jgi:CheY-like chemotaxis protein